MVAGLGLALFAGRADRAVAGPAEDVTPIEVRLEIDTSLAGTGAEVLHRRIEERTNVVLRHAKILAGDRYDLLLQISVRELPDDAPGYAVTFTLTASDGSAAEQPIEISCSLCTETELVARVEAELDPLIPTLRELSQVPVPDVPEPTPPDPDPEPDTDPPLHPKPGMFAGGITLLVVGVGSLAGGVALAIPPPKIDQEHPLDLITTRPIGYAMLATGVALATTGAVLTALAIDRRRRPARLSVAPFGDRGRAGIVVGGRF
jgi:hypothetical protein